MTSQCQRDHVDAADPEAILARMPSIAILISEGRVRWISSPVAFGWPAGALLDGTLSLLWHPDDRATAIRLHELGHPGAGDASRLRVRTSEGQTRWVEVEVSAMADGGILMTLSDVTGNVQAERRAIVMAAELDLIAACSDEVMCRTDGNDRVVWASPAAQRILGWDPSELIGTVLEDLIHPQDRDGLPAPGSDPSNPAPAVRIRSKAGSYRWMRRSRRAWQDLTASATLERGEHLETLVDVTDLVQSLEQASRRAMLLAEHGSTVVAWLREGMIDWVSGSISGMLGWLPEEWAGRRLDDFVHQDDLDAYLPLIADGTRAAGDAELACRFRIRDKGLCYHWVQAHARAFIEPDGRMNGIAASLRIVDAEVAVIDELDRRSRTDELTGLPNRREALARIARLQGHSRRNGDGMAVLLCDVDRFKEINDCHGHAAGDRVLKVLADRITDCIRKADMAARVGGDEILVLLDGVHGHSDALDIAQKIRVAASMPIAFSAGPQAANATTLLAVTLSIGVVVLDDGRQIDDLVTHADLAMYQAKRSGSNRVVCLPAGGSLELLATG